MRDAESKGRIIGVRVATMEEDDDAPWTAPPSRRRKHPPIAGPLPEKIEPTLGDQIWVSKEGLAPGIRNRLLHLAVCFKTLNFTAQPAPVKYLQAPSIAAPKTIRKHDACY